MRECVERALTSVGKVALLARQAVSKSAYSHAHFIEPSCHRKAVREHGQVVNGHKFKRPPSAAILAHYAALGEVWQERYGPHYKAGTVPDDIKGASQTPWLTMLQRVIDEGAASARIQRAGDSRS